MYKYEWECVHRNMRMESEQHTTNSSRQSSMESGKWKKNTKCAQKKRKKQSKTVRIYINRIEQKPEKRHIAHVYSRRMKMPKKKNKNGIYFKIEFRYLPGSMVKILKKERRKENKRKNERKANLLECKKMKQHNRSPRKTKIFSFLYN